MTRNNKKFDIILLLVLTNIVFLSSGAKVIQMSDARTEETLDTSNNNLSISMHAPDDWNSGKLSATIVSLDWKFNELFTSNFATSFLSTTEEPIEVFAVLNSFSWLNMALPFGQKTGLLSFILSQYATVNREFYITLK